MKHYKLICMKSGKRLRIPNIPFGCPSVCPPVMQSALNRCDPERGLESAVSHFRRFLAVLCQRHNRCSLLTLSSLLFFHFHLPSLTSGEQISACLIPSAHTESAPLFCHSSLLRWIYPASKGTVSLWSDDMNLIPRIKIFFFLSDY